MSAGVAEPDQAETTLGTPLAQSWTDEWVARVEAREEELGRRICGARTIGHAPCPAGSTHPSGRCVHHGGFDLTGAPEGNRNAAVHFLYARRVMPCGEHCPAWRSCPLGGGGADHGKAISTRAYADRPACPFEQAEYNAVVTDALKRTQFNHENSWGLHLAHQLALMTIMVSRSARFLATHPFTDNVEVYQGEHHTITTKPAAALIAYDKLTRELRRWTLLLERGYQWVTCDQTTATRHKHRQTTDTQPDPDSLAATAEGQGIFNHRGHREHREVQRPVLQGGNRENGEVQEQERQDEQNLQDRKVLDLDPTKKNSSLTSSLPSVSSCSNALDLDPNLRPSAPSADESLDLVGENLCQSVGNGLDLPSVSSASSVVHEVDLALPKKNLPLTSIEVSSELSAPSADNAFDLIGGSEDGFLAGTADRIHKLIATHVTELLQPSKISDPSNGNLRNILNPGQGP